MPLISLRAYNREVESLIDRNLIDEALAHCKHILANYPKCIDTYRIMAKAYLESKRYPEASDMFSRVLAVFPDDFISHVGMSIIKEDEGNLDAAIWHMELAFDLQPSNLAVQGELRRLFGRRDGVQPSKIRLTRGALIRMYARGDLYQQAIAEITSALAEDSNRIDLQIILARMYYQSGLLVEATETCGNILGKLPFCFEANLILIQILPGTNQADSIKTYKERLVSLDPYFNFVTPPNSSSESVPAEKVMLEHLSYSAVDQLEEPQNWARSIGLQWDNQPSEKSPEWTSDLNIESDQGNDLFKNQVPDEGFVENPVKPVELSRENADAEYRTSDQTEIPDWMLAAGWKPSTGQETSEELTADEDNAPISAEPGELPAWLKEIAPQSQNSDQPIEETDSFEGVLPVSEIPSSNATISDDNAINQESEETFDKLRESLSEWIHQSQDSTSPITNEKVGENMSADNAPENNEWLNQLRSDSSDANPEQPQPEGDLPDWLKSFEEEQNKATPKEDDLPDWLKSLQQEPTPPVEPEPGVAPVDDVRQPEPVIPDIPIPTLPDQEFEPSAEETPQSTEKMDSILSDRNNLFTKILEEKDKKPGEATTGYLTPESHPLPEDWHSEVAKEEVAPSEESAEASDIPEWVRKTLQMGEFQKPPEAPVSESAVPEMPAASVENLIPAEPAISNEETPPSSNEGAISEETNTELLDWLRTLESNETVEKESGLPTEALETEIASTDKTDSDFDFIDRLKGFETTIDSEEETGKEPLEGTSSEVISFVRDENTETEPAVPADTGYSPDEMNIAEEVSPVHLAEAEQAAGLPPSEPPTEVSYESTVTTPIEEAQLDPFTKISTLLDNGAIQEAVADYQGLLKSDVGLRDVEKSIRDSLLRYGSHYELWQLLGDTLAKQNLFEEAFSAYDKAESLLLEEKY